MNRPRRRQIALVGVASVLGLLAVAARPEHIWPWLVQLGSGRAGWYAIDRIDNAGCPAPRQFVLSFRTCRWVT